MGTGFRFSASASPSKFTVLALCLFLLTVVQVHDTLPRNWCGHGHVTHFKFWDPTYIIFKQMKPLTLIPYLQQYSTLLSTN